MHFPILFSLQSLLLFYALVPSNFHRPYHSFSHSFLLNGLYNSFPTLTIPHLSYILSPSLYKPFSLFLSNLFFLCIPITSPIHLSFSNIFFLLSSKFPPMHFPVKHYPPYHKQSPLFFPQIFRFSLFSLSLSLSQDLRCILVPLCLLI